VRGLVDPLRVVEHARAIHADVEVAGDAACVRRGFGRKGVEDGVDPPPGRLGAIGLHFHDHDAARDGRVVADATAIETIGNRRVLEVRRVVAPLLVREDALLVGAQVARAGYESVGSRRRVPGRQRRVGDISLLDRAVDRKLPDNGDSDIRPIDVGKTAVEA
jgi:hypothetical protein